MRAFYLIAAFVLAVATGLLLGVDFELWSPDGQERLQMYQSIIGLLLVTWLVTDSKVPKEQRPSFDHAMLHLVFFPLFAFYQQFVARRWRGVALVFGLLLISLLPWLVAIGIASSR